MGVRIGVLTGDRNNVTVPGVGLLGPLEARVVDYLSAHGESTVRDVWEGLGRDNAYTTIMTTLTVLARKGVVSQSVSSAKKRAFVYAVAINHAAYFKQVVGSTMDALLNFDRDAVMEYLQEQGLLDTHQ